MKNSIPLFTSLAFSICLFNNHGIAASRKIPEPEQYRIATAIKNQKDLTITPYHSNHKREHLQARKHQVKHRNAFAKKASGKKGGKKALGILLLLASAVGFSFGVIALFGGAFGAPAFIGIGIAIMLGTIALGAFAFKLINPNMKPWKRWLFSLAANVGIGLLFLALLQLIGG
ncbi:MAG: hypothetical protein R2830_19260 [Saprospiraceae bacterium]